MAHDNELMYAAFAKNYLNRFLFISEYHGIMSKVKYKVQFYTSR